jgi:hypothetical protein
MTTANLTVIGNVLFKRGNSTVASAYTGVPGEIIIDTTLQTIRVQDGTTVGGHVLASAQDAANIAGFAPNIATLFSNAAIQATQISSLQANAALQASLIDTLTGNAATQGGALNDLVANAAVQAESLTTLTANAAVQANSLTNLIANAATQAQQIANVSGTYGNANVQAYMTVFDGNILPAANVTYSLGSEQFQWRDLWVSNNTIYIGGTPVRVDGGTLLVNNAPVSGSAYGNTQVADYLLGNISTGNITAAANVMIIGTGDAKLTLDSFNQAALLQAKKTFNRSFDEGDGASFVYSNVSGTGSITATITSALYLKTLLERLSSQFSTPTPEFTYSYSNVRVQVYDVTNANVIANVTGVDNYGNPDEYTLLIDQPPTPDPFSVLALDISYDYLNTVGVDVDKDLFGITTDNDDIDIKSGRDIDLQARDDFFVSAGSEFIMRLNANDGQNPTDGIILETQANGTTRSWAYRFDGATEFASGLTAEPLGNYVPVNGTVLQQTENEILQVLSKGSSGGMSIGWAENPFVPSQTAALTFNSVANQVQVITGNYAATTYSWTFGTDGNLTLPNGTLIRDTGSVGTSGIGLGNHGFNIDFGSAVNDWAIMSGANLIQVQPDTAFNISFPEVAQWQFNIDGNLTFPDGTKQITAYTGGGGGGTYGNANVQALLASNVSLIGSSSNIILATLGAGSTTTVTQEGGTPGVSGQGTITGASSNSPGVALVQPGWTVTGNNLVGTTTVTNVSGPDGFGTYTITTDTTEVDPFWYNDVYTFTSNTPSYSNLTVSSGNINNAGTYGQINFVANSSGDGYGLSTIQLVPYTAGYDSAYIIIDPTYPNHIHIRAGGEQDNSPASLILGGENSHFQIPSGANSSPYIKSNGYNWQFGTDGNLTFPTGGNLIFDSSATSIIDGVTNITANGNVTAAQYNFANGVNILDTITGVTSISSVVNTSIWSDASGDYQYGTLDYSYAVNGNNGQFAIEYSFPLVYGNVDVNVGNVIASNVTTTNGIFWANGQAYSTGNISVGDAIAIGYNSATVSQGGGAVAVGSTAGNVSQGIGAVAVGEAAGTLSQGAEGIAIGKTAGEQSQGAYSIAIGSAAAYYQQRTGAIAIGTSAGALQQGNHAIAIGTGAGSALQGNNSIILNATGSALEQTTDNTFTVKPIRNASGSTVLYYDSTTGEITYDTAGAGTYGNTEVAAYLPAYTGNVGAARVQVTNAVDFMYGGFPYMGWQLSGSDTLKLRTNIASGDYTNDAVIVDRQSLAVNVVATLSAGNIITTSGVFWSNGTAYSTGSGTYGNTEVAAYLLTGINSSLGTLVTTNFSTANARITGGSITGGTGAFTTLQVSNFSSGNVFITGAGGIGYAQNNAVSRIGNVYSTYANFTNFSTANAVITGGSITGITGAATTWTATNFSSANVAITGGYASGLANVTVTGNVTAGNLIGYGSNTTITAGTYTSTFDNVGMVTVPNLTVSGSVDATSITTDSLTINDTGWTNFTPTWYAGTGTNSVGDGLAEGRYRQLGKTVEVWMQITMGSTTTFGTGEYKVSLPVASRMLGSAVLSLVMSDTGTRLYNSLAHNAYTTTLFHTSSNVTLFWDTGVVTNTSPFTWTNGDFFVIAGTYEAS